MRSFASGETAATEWQGLWKLETALEAWPWVTSGVAAASLVTDWRANRCCRC